LLFDRTKNQHTFILESNKFYTKKYCPVRTEMTNMKRQAKLTYKETVGLLRVLGY